MNIATKIQRTLKRFAIELLITFSARWNDKYNSYKCPLCFWMDMGLNSGHEAHN